MAQFLVRGIEDEIKARLQRRAKRHGRSMEDEVRHILRDATKQEHRAVRRLGTCIAARFETVSLTTDLPELRGEAARPAGFKR